MKIIDPSFEILSEIDGKHLLKSIEVAGRTAYKSENKITGGSAEKFVKTIIGLGHESVIEHVSLTIRFICSRGISHEVVRHRLASYTQESTRYCSYDKDRFGSEVTVIAPKFYKKSLLDDRSRIWKNACESAETAYFQLLREGLKPEMARSVLPNSLKTEIVMTANLREWRHFFKLRTSRYAHPEMRRLSIPLLQELKKQTPIIFDDIEIIT